MFIKISYLPLVAAAAMTVSLFSEPNPTIAETERLQGSGFRLTVDANANCFNVYYATSGNPVRHDIQNGRYKVDIVNSNVHYCGDGCENRKVALFNTSDDQPYGWSYIVRQGRPTFIKVSGIGTDANAVYAFFIDGICSDNTGSAILEFKPVGTIPGD